MAIEVHIAWAIMALPKAQDKAAIAKALVLACTQLEPTQEPGPYGKPWKVEEITRAERAKTKILNVLTAGTPINLLTSYQYRLNTPRTALITLVQDIEPQTIASILQSTQPQQPQQQQQHQDSSHRLVNGAPKTHL